MIKKSAFAIVLTATAVLISGCGGGGDSGGTTVSTASFPAQSAYRARVVAGSTDNFTVSGTCAGTASYTDGVPTASTFEGVTGFAAPTTVTINLTNCTPATNTASGTSYYDGNYSPLGDSIPGVEYAKFVTLPPPLPAAVKVGDTAVYATFTTYTDSTKATITGQEVLSYVVEPDTPSTAVVNLITKQFNTSNQLLSTQQSRYRIGTDGSLSTLTIDVQFSTTSTTHLVFTKS